MRTLVLIHGRSQAHKNAAGLKAQWLEALRTGLRAAQIDFDVSDEHVRFPYYGDTLDRLITEPHDQPPPDVVVMGALSDDQAAQDFVTAAVNDAVATCGVTESDFAAVDSDVVVPQNIENNAYVLKALRALEHHIPGVGNPSIALVTHDVYVYLTNPGVQTLIERGVKKALDDEGECVLVGHSLGSIVGYNILRRRAESEHWSVPTMITVGCPLGIVAVKDRLAPIGMPLGVTSWFNAFDPSDVVALHPLDSTYFPVEPPIENYANVHNSAKNHHSIPGYLSDPTVAERIHRALTD